MKRIVSICLLLLLAVITHANEIDSLITKRAVEQFLATKIDTNWKYVSPFEDNKVHTKKFTKAGFLKKDFDHNGLTDLLIYGQNCFVVLDLDSMPYGLYGNYTPPYNINLEESGPWFVDIVNVKEDPLLIFKDYVWQYDTKSWAPTYDTFIYKLGSFLKYNPTPGSLQIEAIHFTGDEGYGATPFEMNVDAVGWMDFHEGRDVNSSIFAGFIDSASFSDIKQVVNYINFIALEDYYEESITDLQTYELTIKFKGGKAKKITDYGGWGTSGLMNLYNRLFYHARKLNEFH